MCRIKNKFIIRIFAFMTIVCGFLGNARAGENIPRSSELFVCEDAKNQFGQTRYRVCHHNAPDLSPLPIDNGSIWTIVNPTPAILEYYSKNFPLTRTRVYNNTEYLMSSMAFSKIPPPGINTGAAVILTFEDKSTQYVILTVDNKKYLQNVQGSSKPNENPVKTALREVYEETGIFLLPDAFKHAGSWSFQNFNELIGGYRFIVTTSAFYASVSINDVRHLLPHYPAWQRDKINIIPAKSYPFRLDETQYVIIIPVSLLDTTPESFDLDKNGYLIKHSFNGHHRELLHRVFDLSRSFNTDYLYSFEVYK